MTADRPDAYVIGAGPNGLAAAITLAEAGRSVHVVEAADTPGGGCRTAELTRPGFAHDVCATVHTLAAGSPFFADQPLADLGFEVVHPTYPAAHPLPDGTAAVLDRSLIKTAGRLDAEARYDGDRWRNTVGRVAGDWPKLRDGLLGPPLRVPRHPLAMARFGMAGLRSAETLADEFESTHARALIAGMAAHSFLPLDAPLSASFALVLAALGHAEGWPFVVGGSGRLTDALVARFEALGGTIECGRRIDDLADLDGWAPGPESPIVVADVTPTQMAQMAGRWLAPSAAQRMAGFKLGPGVCKVDLATSEPIPWTAAECRQAGTVHVGGTFEEVAAAEAEVAAGQHSPKPFVLVAQASLFDPTRAPDGGHTVWAYCHVPNGSTVDASDRIIDQIERFAPGFRDTILERHVRTAAGYEEYNPSFVGGDISAGAHTPLQVLAGPRPGRRPYDTPVPGVFLCSGATPPGGGVHGMCGLHAAHRALEATGRV